MDKITKEQEANLYIIKENQRQARIQIRKTILFLGYRILFDWRSKKNIWGRFGGGWNWKLGFQIGGSTLILDMLIFSIRIDKLNLKK